MPAKAKPNPLQDVINESQSVEREFNEIQNQMQTERNSHLRRWNVQKKLLKETLKYIDQLRRNESKVRSRQKKQENWDIIFKCDGLPHTFRPDALRIFISKWEYEMQSEVDSQLDWSLQRSEQSILTQDDSVPDKTLAKLRANRIERGHKLVKKMKDVEYILNGIRKITHFEGGSFTKDEKQALRMLRTLMQKSMKKYIDVYTFMLLKNMEGEMEPTKIFLKKDSDFSPRKSVRWGKNDQPEQTVKIDITSLQHSFNNEEFSYHIWALRDVPQPPRAFVDRFTIPLASFGGEASFPYAMAMQDLAFRSYWTPFDHYSTHSPTYVVPSGPAPVIDLLSALVQEWSERDRIDEEKFALLNSKKMEFESALHAWTAEEQGKQELKKMNEHAKDKKPQKKKKRTKIKREKLTFGDFQKYDSKIEYINYEDKQYEDYLNKMLPSDKALISGDVNLRSHQILGGIFHLEFLPKPTTQAGFFAKQLVDITTLPSTITNLQTIKFLQSSTSAIPSESSIPKFDDLTVGRPSLAPLPSKPGKLDTQRKNLADILKGREASAVPQKTELAAPMRATRMSLKEALRRSELSFDRQTQLFFEQTGSRLTVADDNLVMIEFQIKLPPKIMWWTKPMVCYWEPWEYSDEFQNLSESEKEFYRNYEAHKEKLQQRLFKPVKKPLSTEKYIPDFDMQNIPKTIDFREICREYILPALPYHYQTYIDIVLDKHITEESQRKKRIEIGLQESSVEVIERKSTFRQDIDRTPPAPLFVPREQNPLKVNIVDPILSDEEEDADSNYEEIIFKNIESENYVDEFRPPSILFSEFYKEIVEQSEKEICVLGDNDLERELRIQTTSDEFPSVTDQLSFGKRASKRRSKRTKSRTGTEKLKDRVEERLTYVEQEQQVHSQESQEFRGSMMHHYVPHHSGRWCQRKIVNQWYDEELKLLTFRSPCFGAYALAVDRYQHMPYRSWILMPVHGKNLFATLHVRTPFIDLQIRILPQGYTLRIPPKSQIPIDPELGPQSLFDFKRMLSDIGLNIFPEQDGACYVNGITEKHQSLEKHIYNSMAWFCKYFRFEHSPWNRLAHRRQIVMHVQHDHHESRIMEKKFFDVLITPNECYRSKIREACSIDLDEINLEFEMDPPEQEYQPDFFFLLKSEIVESDIKETDEQMLCLMQNIVQLLWNIRLLSFS